jgi:threonine aldolase
LRFISAQFIPYLKEGIWLENAHRSNAAAQKLATGMRKIGVELIQKVESNQLFFILPKEITDKLLERYFFYPWNEKRNESRLVCSWDTTDKDIEEFLEYLRGLMCRMMDI